MNSREKLRQAAGKADTPQPEPTDPAKRPGSAATSPLRELFPLGEIPEGAHVTQHLDVQLRAELERRTLARLRIGLRDRSVRLDDGRGRHVENNADVIRYILQEIARDEQS